MQHACRLAHTDLCNYFEHITVPKTHFIHIPSQRISRTDFATMAVGGFPQQPSAALALGMVKHFDGALRRVFVYRQLPILLVSGNCS